MSSIWDLMRQRFPEQEYAIFFEVPNATGARATNYADALVVSLWPSRGLTVHGFEIKVSRGDWLREMKNPAKAESIAKYCDRWSLAVSDPAIVKAGELPATWGLWAPRGNSLTCVTEAKPLEPKAIDRNFMAAIARSAQKMAARQIAKSSEVQELERKLKEQRDVFETEVNDRVERQLKRAREYSGQLQKTVEEFEKITGLSLTEHAWDIARIAETVKLVRGMHSTPATDVAIAKKRLETALAALNAVEACRAVGPAESVL